MNFKKMKIWQDEKQKPILYFNLEIKQNSYTPTLQILLALLFVHSATGNLEMQNMYLCRQCMALKKICSSNLIVCNAHPENVLSWTNLPNTF